jgi:predicted ATPase
MQLRYLHAATVVSLSDLVGARFLMLNAEARTIVGCAALLGYRFDVPVLAASAGVTVQRALAALRRAQSLDLIVADPGALPRYRFRHDLTRAAVRQRLDPQRQNALHAMIAAALEASPDAALHNEQLAHHWAAAGNAERAAFHLERALHEARLLGLGG